MITPAFLQVFTSANASPDDVALMIFAQLSGVKKAATLAAGFGLPLPSPLQASRATTNARGKNYSGKSAKHKPL